MNLTFVDCCDKSFIKLVLKNVIKLAKGSLNNNFQDSFNKFLSQQLTHDKPYMSITKAYGQMKSIMVLIFSLLIRPVNTLPNNSDF